MTEGYEVPKHEIEAELVLVDDEPRRVRLFLGERAAHHSGRERPSDLLNAAEDPFFAVRASGGGILLVHRDAVVILSVSASAEAGPEQELPPVREEEEAPSGEALVAQVRMGMENGRDVVGTVREIMPAGARRIQDYLNRAEPFVPLRDGDTVRFVNRARIARVEFV